MGGDILFIYFISNTKDVRLGISSKPSYIMVAVWFVISSALYLYKYLMQNCKIT